MALSKAMTVVQDWTAVAQNAIVESSERDVSGDHNMAVLIQAALDTITAHTGTEFIILINPHTSDDEDWFIWPGGFVELVGTALTENLTNNPLAAGQSTLTMADTAGFETNGSGIDEIPGWRFIEDGVSLAASELIYQMAFVTDTSISWAGVNKNSHVQNTPLYNIAISKVVQLPMWAQRVKVIVNNAYDADGSTLNYRILVGEVTGVG